MTSGFDKILTVDGASGTGKTALLRALADRYGGVAVELGPVVRAVSWIAEARSISVVDAVAALAQLEAAGRVRIDRPGASDLAASEVELDGKLLRQRLFAGSLSAALTAASLDADAMSWIHGLVRESLRGRSGVLSAREGATAVCPMAGLRVRLEANAVVRAARKKKQLAASGVRAQWMDDVRLLGPPDMVHAIIDTSAMRPRDLADLVGNMAERALGWVPVVASAAPELSEPLAHVV